MKLKLILVCTLFNLIGASLVLTGFTNQPLEDVQIKPVMGPFVRYIETVSCPVWDMPFKHITIEDIERIVE